MLDIPEGTAAQLMDPMVAAFPEDLEAGEALRRVRRESQRVSCYIYVTDRNQKLVGVLTLRQLIRAPSKRPLASLIQGPVVRLGLRDSHAGVLRHPGWQSFHSLPVVDGKETLVGVVRYETLRRLEAETSSDRSEDLFLLGATLGETWAAVTMAMLDGVSAILRGDGTSSHRGATEARDGK
jgi:magnesium transporter